MTLRTQPNYPTIYTNDHRQQAEQVGNRYSAELSEIDRDPDLTPEGRDRRKQEAYDRAKRDMGQLMSAERDERDGRRKSAERQLFGLGVSPSPADAISLRDAQDRAGRMGLDEINSGMQQALRSGDQTLAAAILSRALEVRSDRAVNAYLDEYPNHRHLIDDLQPSDSLGVLAYMVMAP